MGEEIKNSSSNETDVENTVNVEQNDSFENEKTWEDYKTHRLFHKIFKLTSVLLILIVLPILMLMIGIGGKSYRNSQTQITLNYDQLSSSSDEIKFTYKGTEYNISNFINGLITNPNSTQFNYYDILSENDWGKYFEINRDNGTTNDDSDDYKEVSEQHFLMMNELTFVSETDGAGNPIENTYFRIFDVSMNTEKIVNSYKNFNGYVDDQGESHYGDYDKIQFVHDLKNAITIESKYYNQNDEGYADTIVEYKIYGEEFLPNDFYKDLKTPLWITISGSVYVGITVIALFGWFYFSKFNVKKTNEEEE